MYNMAKRRLALFIIIAHIAIVVATAQDGKRNFLQVKFNIDYFERHEVSTYHALFYPDVSYKRFFKYRQSYVEFGVDVLDMMHEYNGFEPNDLGKKVSRRHFILEGNIGSYILITNRLRLSGEVGIAYRLGNEGRIIQLIYWGRPNQLYEPLIKTYNYKDFGFDASCEFQYQLGNKGKWHLTLSGGGRYFPIRKITTRGHLQVGLGIGRFF